MPTSLPKSQERSESLATTAVVGEDFLLVCHPDAGHALVLARGAK
jgi:hypothetical protein